MRLLALPAFEDNYIWALVDDEGDALVIDPGDAAPVLAATGNGLWPAAVLVTHHTPTTPVASPPCVRAGRRCRYSPRATIAFPRHRTALAKAMWCR